MQDLRVISLQRTPERLERFYTQNSHLKEIKIFEAFDGQHLVQSQFDFSSIATPELSYLPGALGCALSHMTLWKEASSLQKTITIFEDDAIIHYDFLEHQASLLKQLQNWDLILWGWNFDWHFLTVFPHLGPCSMSFDQTCLQNKISSFQSAKVHPTPMQLALASGLCGYSISPHGAQKLLKAILPLSPTIPALGTTIKNTGIDLAMAAVYSQLQIFASFPPLVATENKKSFSTVQSS